LITSLRFSLKSVCDYYQLQTHKTISCRNFMLHNCYSLRPFHAPWSAILPEDTDTSGWDPLLCRL